MEQPSIFLSVEAESLIQFAHYFLFGFSTFFNAVATFCLWKQAPDMQSEIKIYLYGMQVLVFLADVMLDIAIEPFVLLPVLGGYSKGLLGKWLGISDAVLLVLLVLNLVGFCIQSCLLSRHQALIKGRFKLGKPMNFVVRFFLFAFITSPAIYGFMIDWDASETDTLADFYNVSWVRSRGPHMIYRRTTSLGVMLPAVIFVALTCVTAFGTAVTAHTVWYIRNGSVHSPAAAKRNSRALYLLSIQMGLPVLLLSIPAVIFFACSMDGTPFSFGTCSSSLFLISTHSSVHSIVLLAITPAYRHFIVKFVHRIMCKKPPQKRTVSVSGKESIRKL